MKMEFIKAQNHGDVVNTQVYETARGIYELIFVRHNNEVYSFKYLNGKLVECHNLSKMKAVSKNGIRRQTV